MSRNIADSYDLAAARAASRRLSGLSVVSVGPAEGAAPGYVRLESSTRPGLQAVSEPTFEPQDFKTWDEFLDWCNQCTGAASGFAVDLQGFVIGTSGVRAEDGFEGLGAELSYVVGQAGVLAQDDEVLDGIGLVFSGRMVVGFRSPVEGAEGFIVAFVNPKRYDGLVRNQLFAQLKHNVAHLR